jgi:hypothetical protein
MDINKVETDFEKGAIITAYCIIGAAALCIGCYVRKCFFK